MEYDYEWPVVFSGDKNSGKESIVIRAIHDVYLELGTMTEGYVRFEYGKKNISFFIYNHEKYTDKADNKYRGDFMIYNITNRQSFYHVIKILNQGISKPVVLVGSNSDLEAKREVSYDEAKDFAFDKNIPFIEVSAKTGSNIDEMFKLMATAIVNDFLNKNVRFREKHSYYELMDTSGKTFQELVNRQIVKIGTEQERQNFNLNEQERHISNLNEEESHISNLNTRMVMPIGGGSQISNLNGQVYRENNCCIS